MQRSIRFLRRLAPVLAALAVGACASANPFKSDTIEVACPPFGALKEADALTRFRPGDGRDLTDVAFAAEISRVVGECEVTQSTQVARVNAGLEILAERGPAMETDAAPIEYFVAVETPSGKIASRQSFTLALDFRDGLRNTRATDILTFTIPNATPQALRSYKVYFGLQMTRDEWEFSQRSAGTR